MSNCFDLNTTYFWQEGKANLRQCLQISFKAALQQRIDKLVVFTGSGEGVRLALEEFTNQEDYSHIRLIAVTFPQGQEFTTSEHAHGISDVDRAFFASHGVPIVRARLPFDPIRTQHQGQGILGQDFSLLGNVLSIFGGSMSLCVQAVLMACDAGEVRKGEHVVSMTSDTSILVRSAPTSHLLTDFIVREIFCKAALLTIGKQEVLEVNRSGEELPGSTDHRLLGS